jgi:hypothetical protein
MPQLPFVFTLPSAGMLYTILFKVYAFAGIACGGEYSTAPCIPTTGRPWPGGAAAFMFTICPGVSDTNCKRIQMPVWPLFGYVIRLPMFWGYALVCKLVMLVQGSHAVPLLTKNAGADIPGKNKSTIAVLLGIVKDMTSVVFVPKFNHGKLDWIGICE